MTGPSTPPPDDDISAEIDFSGGTRGKFFGAGAALRLPVYLDADVQAYLAAMAAEKGVPPLRCRQRSAQETDRHNRIGEVGSGGCHPGIYCSALLLQPAPEYGRWRCSGETEE